MKILLTLHHAGAFRSYEGVVRSLCSRGHQVLVLHGRKDKPITMDTAMQSCLAELENCQADWLIPRRQWLTLANVRELINCTNYLRPQHPAPWQSRRWINKVIRPVRIPAKNRAILQMLAGDRIQRHLRRIESAIPPVPEIVQWLREYKPDVVIASPFVNPLSEDLEYIKAAKVLNIPNIVSVLSWDNLTSKGTFHVIPDLTLVWNDILAHEAATLHDVPSEKIFLTGAPPFDFWFEMQPSMNYRAFCGQSGIEADKPFIVYLCSSPFIGKDETGFVSEFVKSLSQNERTKDVNVLIRPHPTNASIWESFQGPTLTIWPKGGEYVDNPAAKQNYFDSISHSVGIVGINTSAMLEAAILDKPCITIMADEYQRSQTGVGHFQHLLNANFMEVAVSLSEATSVIGDILAGGDTKKEQRRKFVKEFIRPWGLDKPAADIMAMTIETVGRRQNIRQVMATQHASDLQV
jgi:hypothetical protein